MKAKKVVTEQAHVVEQDPMAKMMSMMQTMASGFDSINRRLNMLEQGSNATDPGNPMMSQPSKRLEKREVKEVPMAVVKLECFTDTRKPYIAKLVMQAGKVERDFFEGNPIRTTQFHGPIIETKLSGHLPIGTVLETRDGYGLSWYAVTEKGAVEIDGYDKATSLLK